MLPYSPSSALGPHARGVRGILVDVVRSRHHRAAEAHQASGSRYSMGFGTQWRDLLDDAHDALADQGFESHKLTPAGYRLPVVNECLIYVWRVPDTVDAVSLFASSPTRKNSFTAPPPPPMLFEPGFVEEDGPVDVPEEVELKSVMHAVGGTMPLVLVMVQSSPRQLQAIEWAVAELDQATGKVKLRGQEIIWEPEPNVDEAAADAESFDSGVPAGPTVEPQQQEGMHPNA